MLAIKISIIYSVLGVAVCQQVGTNDERPFLRILAPKFICNDKKGKQQVAPSESLTIGLQTREGQKLRYRISVDFEMLDGFKNQRHTLSIWKNIRMLERKFNNISEDISLKNQIDINKQEVSDLSIDCLLKASLKSFHDSVWQLQLTSQVIYTFRITGYDEKKVASETQNFTITFKGGELKAHQPNVSKSFFRKLILSFFFA